MQSNSLKNDKYFISIITICLFFLSYNYMRTGFSLRLEEAFSTSRYYWWFFVSFIFIVFFGLFHKQKNSNTMIWFLGACLFLVFFASVKIDISNFISGLALVFFVLCFSFGNRLSNINDDLLLYYLKLVNIIIVIPLSLYGVFMFFTTEMISYQSSTDAFLVPVVYLPFTLLLNEKKVLKIVSYVLLIVVTIISMKRSLIIGVAACSLTYFLLTEHKKMLSKWYFWVLLLIVIFLSSYLYNIVSETLIYRFVQLEEDGGTGRDIMYKQIWTSIQQSNLRSVIFGHGYQSVTIVINKLAHNDFLQLVYDCGLFGAVLYTTFLLSLMALVIRKYRKKETNKTVYAAFVGTIVLYIVLSLFNCVIYTTMLISPLMLALGLMKGIVKDW